MIINWSSNVSMASMIAIAGGVGGLMSFVYTLASGGTLSLSLPWGWLGYMFLGMGTGYLGVYLVAKTDTSHRMHALGFAMACGISWAPIMQASSALIKQNTELGLIEKTQEIGSLVEHEGDLLSSATEEEVALLSGRLEEYAKQLTIVSSKAQSIETVSKASQTLGKIGEVVTLIDRKNFDIAKQSKSNIYQIIAEANTHSIAKLDYPDSLQPFPKFDMKLFESNFPGYTVVTGALELSKLEDSSLLIKKTGG